MSTETSTMHVALPEALRDYVLRRVASGEYGNTSEYIRELIRRDQREQDAARLRAMLEEGLESGPPSADVENDWAELDQIARGRRD
jgi:antitoxin ParD1/3/4